MSRNIRKRTFWNVRPTKTQISLRIRAILGYLKCAQLRFWSESLLGTHVGKHISDIVTQMLTR